MERYMYRAPDWNGEFRHVATGWEEHQNLVRKFAFLAESRAFDSITLLDSTRNIRVLLPIGGGQVFFRLARPRRGHRWRIPGSIASSAHLPVHSLRSYGRIASRRGSG